MTQNGLDPAGRQEMSETQTEADWPSPGKAWYVAAILIFAFTVAYIDRQVISLLVVPIQRDLALSDTQFSFLQGLAFAVFYTLAGLPLGRLADSTKSRRNILAVCALLWGLMTAACGLAKSYGMLFLARVGVGVGEGGLPVNALSVLSDCFPEDRLTLPFGLFVGGTYIGGGLAFILGGIIIDLVSVPGSIALPLIGEVKPWQTVFLAAGTPGLLAAALMLTFKEPRRRGRLDPAKAGTIPLSAVADYVWQRKSRYVFLYLGGAIMGIYGAGSVGWIPAYLIRTFGWTETQVGFGFGPVFMIAGILGTFAASRLERLLRERGLEDARPRIIAVAALAVVPVGAAAPFMPDPWMALLFFGAAIFLYTMPVAIIPPAATAITPNELRGQVTALYLLVIAIVGIGLGPTIIALTTDFVFGAQSAVGQSLSLIAVLASTISAGLLWLSIRPYRAGLEEAKTWLDR